jgi:tetratricopeptide (TPR) repeat protein
MNTCLLKIKTLVLTFLCFSITMFGQQGKKPKVNEEELRNKIQIEELERKHDRFEDKIEEQLDNQKSEVKAEIEESLSNTDKILELKKEDLEWWKWVLSLVIAVAGIVIPWRIGSKFKEVNEAQKEIDITLAEAHNLKRKVEDMAEKAEQKIEQLGEDKIRQMISKHSENWRGDLVNDAKNHSENIKSEINDYFEELKTIRKEEEYTAEDWFIKGYSISVKKDYKKAIEYYTKAIELDSSLGAAYINRGNCFLEFEQYPDALKDTIKGVELLPEDPIGYNNMGLIKHRTKLNDEALINFKRAIDLNPEYADAYSNMGMVLSDEGLHDEAITNYNQAIKLNPNKSLYYNNRGIAYYHLSKPDDIEKAFNDYDTAIKLDSNYADPYNNRAILFVNKKKYNEAIIDYTKAKTLNPNLFNAYLNLCEVYIFTANYEEASGVLRELNEFSLAASHKLTKTYFEVIINKIKGKKTSLLYDKIKTLPWGEDKEKWNFTHLEEWLERAKISEDDKSFIVELNVYMLKK